MTLVSQAESAVSDSHLPQWPPITCFTDYHHWLSEQEVLNIIGRHASLKVPPLPNNQQAISTADSSALSLSCHVCGFLTVIWLPFNFSWIKPEKTNAYSLSSPACFISLTYNLKGIKAFNKRFKITKSLTSPQGFEKLFPNCKGTPSQNIRFLSKRLPTGL